MMQQEVSDDYVISTNTKYSVRDFLNEAFALIGVTDWSPYVIQDPKFMRPAEVDILLGDYSKAKNDLGWEPKTSFKDLVRIMVENDIKILSNGNRSI